MFAPAAGRRGIARLVLLAALAATPAVAQDTLPAPAIIVVDTNQILRDAKAAKDVQVQLEQQETAYSKDVSQQENALKTLQDELERQRTALSPEVFAARSQDFQQRYTALDHDVQVKRQALQQGLNEARDKINNTALQIITDIAKERKANMVMEKAAPARPEAADAGGERAQDHARHRRLGLVGAAAFDADRDEVGDGRSALLRRRGSAQRGRAGGADGRGDCRRGRGRTRADGCCAA
jgi:outer membrane protein